MTRVSLTAEKLREVLHYDPDTGEFRWRHPPPRKPWLGGAIAGSVNKVLGYRIICVSQTNFLAHRLAWFYTHGELPKNQIDHINGFKTDNRIANLRDVPMQINAENRRTARMGKTSSTYLGVFPTANRQKPWVAQVRVAKKTVRVGRFTTEQEAHAAYLSAKRRLHDGCTI